MDILETEVFLHHVLVETTHHDGDKCARDELFEEVVVVAPKIREIEDLELRVGANALMNALIQKGISADRLSAQGKGSEAPIATNDTEEGRAQNRRVEIIIQ